jgi:hypothetical protein
MSIKVKSVYEDLNYANADEMLIKARLVTEIADQNAFQHSARSTAFPLSRHLSLVTALTGGKL